jgi:hypothetical protein
VRGKEPRRWWRGIGGHRLGGVAGSKAVSDNHGWALEANGWRMEAAPDDRGWVLEGDAQAASDGSLSTDAAASMEQSRLGARGAAAVSMEQSRLGAGGAEDVTERHQHVLEKPFGSFIKLASRRYVELVFADFTFLSATVLEEWSISPSRVTSRCAIHFGEPGTHAHMVHAQST